MKFDSIKSYKNKGNHSSICQKFLSNPIDANTTDERCITFTISTDDIDRVGDKVFQDGWYLDNYISNPVVLWAHDDKSLPIGKCVNIFVQNNSLKATVQFVKADVPIIGPLAEAVFQLCRDGFLCATSVGFRPLEFDFTDDDTRIYASCHGADIKRAELLEFSIVSIPCNPGVKMDAIPEQPTNIEIGEENEELATPQPIQLVDDENSTKSINTKTTELDYRLRVIQFLELNSFN